MLNIYSKLGERNQKMVIVNCFPFLSNYQKKKHHQKDSH